MGAAHRAVRGVRLLAAPDKFRGTLTAVDAARAMAAGAAAAGWDFAELPLADGGEGTLDALGGANRTTAVTGPLGEVVDAGWRLDDGVAVVEMARASGLDLAGGRESNDPLDATTRGTGELVAAALDGGASRVLVGVGGSATTDGGLGAVEVLRPYAPLPVQVCCDVQTMFVDAAAVYGPQKGATPVQVEELTRRLRELAERYRTEFGIDVERLPGAGAAGGLAGGLAALGGELAPGFDVVADSVALDEALSRSDLVVTGEGFVDATSFAGKVVGGVLRRAQAAGVTAFVVAGDGEPDALARIRGVSLVARFGRKRAFDDAAACATQAVAALLAKLT
jgi:glycerate 2-kinase